MISTLSGLTIVVAAAIVAAVQPLPTLDKTENFTTVRGISWYAMPDKDNMVFIHDVGRPKSVTLLRTGATLDYEYRGGSLRVVVPESMRTELPDMVKTVWANKPQRETKQTAQKVAEKAAEPSGNVAVIEPTWESLAAHYDPPEWFVDGKLGVWTHWGIPSATDEDRPHDGSHYGRRMYGLDGFITPGKPEPSEGDAEMTQTLTDWHTRRYGHPSEFGYEDLVPLFKAEKWDPDGLVKLFKECGARFIMPLATHHDNFDMYDSSFAWNSVDMGPKRDTLKEWKAAAQKHGLKFGVSTHLYWSPQFFSAARKYQTPGTLASKLFNMDYKAVGFESQDSWNEHWYDRCWELIEKYDPDMFNNDSPYPDEKHGKSLGIRLFTSYLNRDLAENNGEQTTVLSFKNASANKAAFTYNLERGSAGEIQEHPWMWATDISGGWFYRKGAVNGMRIPVMIGNAVDAISKNGVVMLNVALKGDGTLPENQAEYLRAIGEFMKINSEGIYGSRPWKVHGEGPTVFETRRQGENHEPFQPTDIRFTSNNGNLYAFVLTPPRADIVIKTLASGGLLEQEISDVSMLGNEEKLQWKRTSDGLTINLPKQLPGPPVVGFRLTLQR